MRNKIKKNKSQENDELIACQTKSVIKQKKHKTSFTTDIRECCKSMGQSLTHYLTH